MGDVVGRIGHGPRIPDGAVILNPGKGLPGPLTPEIEAMIAERDFLKKEVMGLGVLARALVATLLDASGKGDETAIILSKAEMAAASELELSYQPVDDEHMAIMLSGLTEQKARAAEAMEAQPTSAGVDTFDDPALD